MPNVAAVRLTYNPRVLWFDPNGIEFSAGDALIVKTERGLEYGVADENLKEVSEDAIAKLKSPLKPVMRKATSEDSAKWANLQAQAEEAVKVAKGVEGVTSVSDKLHVRDAKESSVKGYAGDTATTSEIKAKLLADDIVPSRHVKVETTDGVVQLSGTVDSQAQSDRAESIAKAVDGVKSVKNDLKTK